MLGLHLPVTHHSPRPTTQLTGAQIFKASVGEAGVMVLRVDDEEGAVAERCVKPFATPAELEAMGGSYSLHASDSRFT